MVDADAESAGPGQGADSAFLNRLQLVSELAQGLPLDTKS